MKWPVLGLLIVYDILLALAYIDIIINQYPNGVPPEKWFSTYQMR